MPSFLLLLIVALTVKTQSAHHPARSVATRADEVKVEAKTVALADAATPPAIVEIEAAARGLLMPSETDAPILVKFWPSSQTELLPGDVAALAEQTGKPVETKTVAAFFENASRVEAWMNADEKATAQRFGKLSETLQTELENPRVYLFGERERTVVIVGKVKGGFGGVVTLVVET